MALTLIVVSFGMSPFPIHGPLLNLGLPFMLAGFVFLWPGGFALLGVDYVVRLLGTLAVKREALCSWRWWPTPVLILLSVHSKYSQWPLHWAFATSANEFQAAAEDLIEHAPPEQADATGNLGDDPSFFGGRLKPLRKWVGLYDIQQVAVFPEQRVVYFFTGSWFWSGWGFLYNPEKHVIMWERDALAPGWSVMFYAHD